MIKLNGRLAEISRFVRIGSIAADIGTDHAYLPIWLIQNRISELVIAADINEKPLLRAQENIRAHGLDRSGKIITLLTDGLSGLETYLPTDIVIAGMGGELISDILSPSHFVRTPGIRLILQPMTRCALLRRWLCENGFLIFDETLVCDDTSADKIYEILLVEYNGKVIPYTEAGLLVGEKNIQKAAKNPSPLFTAHLEKRIRVLQRKISGLRCAAKETESSFSDIAFYQDILSELIRIRDDL